MKNSHGIFYNTLLIAKLAEPRGLEIFDSLKAKFGDDANVMVAVYQYESQLKEATETKDK